MSEHNGACDKQLELFPELPANVVTLERRLRGDFASAYLRSRSKHEHMPDDDYDDLTPYEDMTPEEKEVYRDRFFCADCGECTFCTGEYYMVSNALWAAAGMKPDGGMLCLACLECRIGRKLTGDDFTAVFPSVPMLRR
jgi:hypothetical protein